MDYYSLWYDVFGLLDAKTRLMFVMVCKTVSKHFLITELSKKDMKCLNRLCTIPTVSILKNLQILYAGGETRITQRLINKLDLVELNVSSNPQIKTLSHMKLLKKLKADYDVCGIDQNGIRELQLVYFSANNPRIKDVSFMQHLKILYAESSSGIDQNGIMGLDLTEFYARGNYKINNVSFMRNLKILDASIYCGINQKGIIGLDLIELNAWQIIFLNVSYVKRHEFFYYS